MIRMNEKSENILRILRKITGLLVITAVLSCLYSIAHSQDEPSLAATLNKTQFSINDSALLSIIVSGSRSADINFPDINNLLIDMRGRSVQMQMINGSYSSSVTMNYSIRAEKAGKYTIPALDVNIGGKVLQTEPLSFTVTDGAKPGNSQTAQQNNGNSNEALDKAAFFLIEGAKENAFTGETIPVEIKAYFQKGLRVELLKQPVISGEAFAMSLQDGEPEQRLETYNGRNYSVVIWKAIISPVKEGEFDLLIDLDATLLIPQRGRVSPFGSNPLFDDDFFNNFFGNYQRKNVQLETPDHHMVIRPLPQQGKPEGFSGAIGEFDFSIAANPTAIEVGDPITLTMKVIGKGNFDRIAAPQFPSGKDWKTYAPSSQFAGDSSGYNGEKVFEQAIVAKSGTITAIPAISFSYFDLSKNDYVTKTSKPIALQIKSTNQQQQSNSGALLHTTAQPNTKLQEVNKQPLPLAAVRLQATKFYPKIAPIFLRAWFVAIASGAIAIIAVVLVLFWRQKYLQNNQEILKKSKINASIHEKLRLLESSIAEKNVQVFLQLAREIIQAKLGLLWQIEPSTITQQDLAMRLPSHSPIVQIFSTAEQHAYGGMTLSSEEMKDCLYLLRQELEELS